MLINLDEKKYRNLAKLMEAARDRGEMVGVPAGDLMLVNPWMDESGVTEIDDPLEYWGAATFFDWLGEAERFTL